jgi:hypothetical protein
MMSRLDRQFAAYRSLAFAQPLTHAQRLVVPSLRMTGGIMLALSVNK